MKTLLECRFLRTALSDDALVDQTIAMADFDEFYMSATSLLAGDWQIAGREYAKVLYLLNDISDGKKRILPPSKARH